MFEDYSIDLSMPEDIGYESEQGFTVKVVL